MEVTGGRRSHLEDDSWSHCGVSGAGHFKAAWCRGWAVGLSARSGRRAAVSHLRGGAMRDGRGRVGQPPRRGASQAWRRDVRVKDRCEAMSGSSGSGLKSGAVTGLGLVVRCCSAYIALGGLIYLFRYFSKPRPITEFTSVLSALEN
jgi:hypothetical protein